MPNSGTHYDWDTNLVEALHNQGQIPLAGIEVGFGGGQPIGWRPTGQAKSLDDLRKLFSKMRTPTLADVLEER